MAHNEKLTWKQIKDFTYEVTLVAGVGKIGKAIHSFIEDITPYSRVVHFFGKSAMGISVSEICGMVMGVFILQWRDRNLDKLKGLGEKANDHSKCLAEQVPIAPKLDYSKEWTKQIKQQSSGQEIKPSILP